MASFATCNKMDKLLMGSMRKRKRKRKGKRGRWKTNWEVVWGFESVMDYTHILTV